MNNPNTSPWLLRHNSGPRTRLRLFCFPYAGGGPLVFRRWPAGLPEHVEVCAVQLPGRGARLMEKPYTRMTTVVKALVEALSTLLDVDYAFFGHSMGAWIGFELARALRGRAIQPPCHLFVSGAGAPHLPQREAPLHSLPEPELMKALRRLNGTPEEVLDHPELMQLLLPTLRADFAVCETYSYRAGARLNVPISVFGGLEDRRLRPGDLKAWREVSTAECTVRMLPGDHFFINTAQHLLLKHIGEDLLRASVFRADRGCA